MARGACKLVSVNGALTVTFTTASGATPVVFSDEACTTTVALPATVADGANTTFYFASPGAYTLSVKTPSGVQIAGDLGATRTISVTTGEVAVLTYDTRIVARDASGDSGRNAVNAALAGTYEAGTTIRLYVGGAGASDSNDGKARSRPFATVGAAVAALPASGGLVEIASNAFTSETGAVDIDVSKVGLRGDASQMRWVSIPGAGYCIKFYCSAPSFGYGGRIASKGVSFSSSTGNPLTGVGVQIGDGTNQAADFSLEDGYASAFTLGVKFLNNAYRITFDKFDLRGSGIATATGMTNAGESMAWKNSLFSQLKQKSVAMTVYRGGWTFTNCRFDDAPLIADGESAYGNTNVTLRDCHQENPNLGVFYFLTAQNQGRIDVCGGRTVVDDPGGAGFNQGMFSSATCTYPAGVYVHNDVTMQSAAAYYTAPRGGQSQTIDSGGAGWVVDQQWVVIGATGAPAFQNSFHNTGTANEAVASYKMAEGGVILVRGDLTGGSGAFSVAFTLPSRYRPSSVARCGGYSGTSLILDNTGAVTPSATAVNLASLAAPLN